MALQTQVRLRSRENPLFRHHGTLCRDRRRGGIKPRAKRMLNRRRIEEKSAAPTRAVTPPQKKRTAYYTARLITAVTAMAAASLLEKNPEGEEYQ